MNEEWRPVKRFGYDEDTGVAAFEVSNFGNVRRTGFIDKRGIYHKPRILPIYVDKCRGRCSVSLKVGATVTAPLVHTLVAEAFLIKPSGAKKLVRRDNNPRNNRADNLYWSCEPVRHTGNSGRSGKPVRIYSLNKELLGEFEQVAHAAKALSVSAPAVSRCCRRYVETYLGLIWRYTCDDEIFVTGMTPKCSLEELAALCSTCGNGSPRCSIRQYDTSGHLLSVGTNASSWQADGVHNDCVIQCCTRDLLTAYGYIWRYEIDDELFSLSEDERKTLITKMLLSFGNSSPVRQYSIDGKLLGEYETLSDASEKSGVPYRGISDVCRKYRRRTAGGFVWRYVVDDDLINLDESSRVVLISSPVSKAEIR